MIFDDFNYFNNFEDFNYFDGFNYFDLFQINILNNLHFFSILSDLFHSKNTYFAYIWIILIIYRFSQQI